VRLGGTNVSANLLPRANLRDVVRGRAPLVGARLDSRVPRGWVSPVEARIHLGIPYGDLVAEEARLLRERHRRADLALLVRVGLARVTAPSPAAAVIRSPWIVSSHVDNLSIEQALDGIFTPPLGVGARIVHFVHPHALNVAYADRRLGSQLDSADLVLPDGFGIRVAARLLGVAVQHNLNGSDLWPLLIRRAAAEGVPLVFVGAAPGVALSCAQRLEEEIPGLEIPIVSDGYLDETASRELTAKIGALDRCMVLVGMGTPLQEAWTWTHLAALPGVTALTVGALFDFMSGNKPRAPHAWRELGLEWLHRLLLEPRRLGRRYLVGNPLFLLRAARQRLQRGRRSAAR
jgi:N-acetylglucosaminyldiphosphoundecaprenol N-acetyl-beta-D-mannosaminyltransferase